MLVVVGLISLMVGISFPALSAGIDSLRLSTAADSVASFLNSALNRAERRQEVMEIAVSRGDNKLVLQSAEPGSERTLALPDGVTVARVVPELPGDELDPTRRFLLYPGGVAPRIGIEIGNRRGARRLVMVDPITGVPQVQDPAARQESK
jgi:hypothetical protein